MSRRTYNTDENRLDPAVSSKIGGFLYDRAPHNSDEEVKRKYSRDGMSSTIIKGRKMARAVSYYATLRDVYKSENARILADILQLTAISDNGIGRAGAENILKGQLPKEIEIETSTM